MSEQSKTSAWVLYTFAAFSFLAGITSLRSYRVNGFIPGKNTTYYGAHAIVVVVAELALGVFLFAVALRSHLKSKKNGLERDP